MGSVVHDSFSIERTYPAAPDRVFAAWTTLDAKKQWFGNEAGIEPVGEQTLDFRVGGQEHFTAKAEGRVYDFDATYCDIVENERIVWTYDMRMDGERISVSLATVEIAGTPGGTKLVMTEQGAFLDGLDTNDQRREGTEQFLGNLASFLAD
ncbi:MAG: hypothetical protein QOJ34_2646 [Pseudonocardiales bacterium]|jgi:uncharacterized protein YndB with AHSA1/START domain|nr:hypothetical protein [Pseudonocardiales bacterium]